MNKQELELENKKLKDIIRELREEVAEMKKAANPSEIDVDSLPKTGHVLFKEGKDFMMLKLKFDPEMGDFVMLELENLGSKDYRALMRGKEVATNLIIKGV